MLKELRVRFMTPFMLHMASDELKLARKSGIYLELMKPEKTIFYWLNALSGVFLAVPFPPPLALAFKATFAIGFAAFSIYALNDICDSEVDRINKPGRPIPSGRLSRTEATGLVLALSALGISVASSLNPIVLVLVLVYILIGVAYSAGPFRLKKGLFSNPCMASGAAISILAGASTIQVNTRALFGAVAMFFFVCTCGSGKDMKDVEGDRTMGIETLPVVIGHEKTMKLFTINSALAFSIFFSGYLLHLFNPLYLLALIVAVMIYVKGLRLMWTNPRDSITCERGFQILVSSGMLILLALIIGSVNA
jgi:geranylgeranylglycerol-phosphate geranylgeranyltransferase